MPTPGTMQRGCWPGETPSPHCCRRQRLCPVPGGPHTVPPWLWARGPWHRGTAEQTGKGWGRRVPGSSCLPMGPRPLAGCWAKVRPLPRGPGTGLPAQLRALVPFSLCQGDAPWLDPLVFPHRLAPAQPVPRGTATLGSACPGLLCGGEPEGQCCLAELPPSSPASCSCSRLGRCLCPVLLPGAWPYAVLGSCWPGPRHCPVPSRSWSVWT